MNTKEILIDRIARAYADTVSRGNFNGVKIQEIDGSIDAEDLRTGLMELISERKIDIISSATALNPHIKRHQVPRVEVQLESLDINERYHTCIYPTPDFIAVNFDFIALGDLPFSKQLAQGQPQLTPVFFDVGVIDRYRQDPRYLFRFSEYAGTISALSESEKTGPILERDQISIQTFGLGMDDDRHPSVCVFLRYLSQLSSEHQRHWETYLSDRPALMHENYFKPTILGEVWENNSAIAAIRQAILCINKICLDTSGVPIFLNAVPADVHYNLSPFMRPTKSDYSSFAHELDKLLSENINPKFFSGKLQPYRIEHHADGSFERKPKGTISLLEEWLFTSFEIPNEEKDKIRQQIIEPLRKVRRERQTMAHSIVQNEFDIEYTTKRRKVLGKAAFALGNLLQLLVSTSETANIRMPRWLEEGRIEVI